MPDGQHLVSASANLPNENSFFENDLPQEFIIKPALGGEGHGVNLYRYSDNCGRQEWVRFEPS